MTLSSPQIKHFSADVYIGKIYINVPRTQYNFFNQMMCMQTTYYCIQSNCLLTAILFVWLSGSDV